MRARFMRCVIVAASPFQAKLPKLNSHTAAWLLLTTALAPSIGSETILYIYYRDKKWMNYNKLIKYKRATERFVDFESWQNPIALTLTCKKVISPVRPWPFWIDEYAASQNVGHFLNLLNARLVSRTERRRGVRIGTYAVLERDQSDRPHCHAMIECPNEEMIDRLPALVPQLWRKTHWGHRHTVVKTCWDDGWLDYITKFRTKFEYDSGNDWLNFTPPKKKVS